ncbi:hypothetical protein ACA30_19690 [Virgibacillus soli]|nr:hypothetical protein ACA30_19690 [Virgibacillus soli]
MKWRKTLFAKIVMILLLIVIPITGIYTYSYYQSLTIMENEVKERNLNRLSIVKNQIDSSFDNMSILLLSLSGHSSIKDLKSAELYSEYEQFFVKRQILDQLALLQGVSSWKADFSVYAPRHSIALETKSDGVATEDIAREWELRTDKKNGTSYFIKHLIEPINSITLGTDPDIVMEVKVPVSNIESYLDQLKLNQYSDPFMYQTDKEALVSASGSKEKMREIINLIPNIDQENQGNVTVVYDDQEYFLTYMKLDKLGWIIVDYTLAENVFAPLTKTRNMFYLFVTIMLLLSILTTYLFYQNIQSPIRNMIRAIQRIKGGNYSARIKPNQIHEFQFMVSSFNDMSQQLETLIEEVYKEKIRYQEVHLKQLQFQINPHFLYNCLFIIKNMAKLKQYEGIEAMSLHLGNYYRYMTKIDDKKVTLREELEFVKNYLDIHVIRLQRLNYEINVVEEMNNLYIPRLLIQPIVENALEHGIKANKEGEILLTGRIIDGLNHISIEDSGMGLSEEELEKLQQKINTSISSQDGQGTWNVHQRLTFHFGEDSGLIFSKSSMGGLKVTIRWR